MRGRLCASLRVRQAWCSETAKMGYCRWGWLILLMLIYLIGLSLAKSAKPHSQWPQSHHRYLRDVHTGGIRSAPGQRGHSGLRPTAEAWRREGNESIACSTPEDCPKSVYGEVSFVHSCCRRAARAAGDAHGQPLGVQSRYRASACLRRIVFPAAAPRWDGCTWAVDYCRASPPGFGEVGSHRECWVDGRGASPRFGSMGHSCACA
jgi:hypothetical protein